MKEISVLMCVYNTPLEYLEVAINSIFNQTYRDYEFIIVDDGSSEHEVTEFLEALYIEKKILLIKNMQNLGLTKSLNIGLAHCTGKYIARMDADDISEKNRLQEQVAYMNAHPEVCILGAGIEKFGIKSKIQSSKFYDYTKDQEIFRIKLLFANVGPMHPSVIIRRSFLEKNNIKYRNEVKKAQDYALWIECLEANGIIKNMNKTLLKYRLHKGQITEEGSKEQLIYVKKIIKEQIEYYFGDFTPAEITVLTTLYSTRYEVDIKEYVMTLKKIIKLNNEKKCFNLSKFRNEIQQRWLHKCVKCLIRSKDVRGIFTIYFWQCFFSKSMLLWLKSRK